MDCMNKDKSTMPSWREHKVEMNAFLHCEKTNVQKSMTIYSNPQAWTFLFHDSRGGSVKTPHCDKGVNVNLMIAVAFLRTKVANELMNAQKC